MELIELALADIVPYKRNPRRNDEAVDAVAESIRQCSYVAPIIVDENNVILAGHTRYKALQKLGRTSAEVVVKRGLTEEQKKKYRLLDNKTNELAEWDFDLLFEELESLDFGDLKLDWEIDDPPKNEPKEREETKINLTVFVVIDCDDDEQAEELFDRLTEEGYECRISTL